MKVKRFIGGNLESNGYVIYKKEGGEAFVIDPGYNAGVFIDFINEMKFSLKGILLTHLHHDHVGAVQALVDAIPCPIYMHYKDALVYKGKVDVEIEGGYQFDIDGEEKIETIWTPGHTEGSVCFMCTPSNICFTGDTVFDTDLGRTDLPGGSESDMINTIVNVVSKWGNEVYIYPGHDNGCNMKTVREYNTEYLALLEGRDR